MSAVPAVTGLFSPGQIVTDVDLNALRAVGAFALGGSSGTRPVFSAYAATPVQFPSASAAHMRYDSVLEDTDTAYDTTTGLYTVETPGIWLGVTSMSWSSNNAGNRQAMFSVAPARVFTVNNPLIDTSLDPIGRCSGIGLGRLSVGDVVTFLGYQSSGGALFTGSGMGVCCTLVWLSA